MKIKPNFEIVEVAGEFMAIPTGEESYTFQGIVSLSEATAYLLKQMNQNKTEEELVELLIKEYEVDVPTAERDVSIILEKLYEIGIIEDD